MICETFLVLNMLEHRTNFQLATALQDHLSDRLFEEVRGDFQDRSVW